MSDCGTIQNRLQDFLEGKLEAPEHVRVELHLSGCSACTEMLELMRLEPGSTPASPDLAGAVLERTSGSACDRAHEILCDDVDGVLEGLDAALLHLHVARCEDCTALAGALARLGTDLEVMAELQPDATFVADILSATAPRPSRWAAFAERWNAAWSALVHRPRLAWETGYVGAIAMWFVWGAFGGPIEARPTPVPTTEAQAALVRNVKGQISQVGRETWAATAGKGFTTLNGIKTHLDDAFADRSLDSVRIHGIEMGAAALSLDLEGSGKAWNELKQDASTFWEQLVSKADEAG